MQQTTLPIVEEVGADLKKRIGVRIDGYYFFYSLGVPKRSVGLQRTNKKRNSKGRQHGEYQESREWITVTCEMIGNAETRIMENLITCLE